MSLRFIGFGLCWLLGTSLTQAAEPVEIELWPSGLPEPAVQTEQPERIEKGPDGLSRRFNVSKPRLFVHEPTPELRTGAAIIIVPGGGFGRLADEHEGSDASTWLKQLGITAFQLAYRCPTTQHAEPNAGPVQDTQRAIQVVRQRAAEWKIDPQKIGVLGFSAGGQCAAISATNNVAFKAEKQSVTHKPDFMLLIYPFKIYDERSKSLRADIHPEAGLPPTFIAQCADDSSSAPQGSTLLFLELMNRKIPGELHIYQKGGHGFGMRSRPNATGPTDWSLRAADWLRQRELAATKRAENN